MQLAFPAFATLLKFLNSPKLQPYVIDSSHKRSISAIGEKDNLWKEANQRGLTDLFWEY